MSKVRDALKEQHWREVIRGQVESDEAVARFCAREGVSVHRFYWWRRTLRERDGQSAPEVQVSTDGKPSGADGEAGKSFVPVRLPFLAEAPIEVVHPGGLVVRVPTGFDAMSLRRILMTLDPSSSDAGER